ncbi:hypothetical protein STEG23_017863, partial [Scotinomys teguina]
DRDVDQIVIELDMFHEDLSLDLEVGSCFSLSLSIPILDCHHTWCCCGIPSDFYCAMQTCLHTFYVHCKPFKVFFHLNLPYCDSIALKYSISSIDWLHSPKLTNLVERCLPPALRAMLTANYGNR